MKLGSLQHGKDGRLVVISRDLTRFITESSMPATLQFALEHWEDVSLVLKEIYDQLNADSSYGDPVDFTAFASPLPRAYQFLDGSAYMKHVELVRKARGAEMPQSLYDDPLMYQGLSDGFLNPVGTMPDFGPDAGMDFEAEVAVMTDYVPMGVGAKEAQAHIKLVLLLNDVTLRELTKTELPKGFGFVHSKPASGFSPVAVTPEALGDAWKEGKVHLPLVSTVNGALFGQPNAGVDMTFNFARLISHAARTRALCAGTIIGSGTVANLEEDVSEGTSVGSSCLAEKRMLELLQTGCVQTPWLKAGDTVRIEMFDAKQASVFGAIETTVNI